jgi:hypothetical protein
MLICSISLYIKKLSVYSASYGKASMVVGIIFLVSNIISAGVNFYLGTNGVWNLMDFKQGNPAIWSLIFVPYYILTEYIPALAFGIAIFRYDEVVQ